MSRLFLELQRTLDSEIISVPLLKNLLAQLVDSHQSMSESAHVALEFKLPLRQMALKSEISGWRHYPIRIEASFDGEEFDLRVGCRVTYSSTCPCSASLSRQLLCEKFESDFDSHRWLSISGVRSWLEENGSLATPHSQRSHVDVTVKLSGDQAQFPIELLITEVETALNTPVQAAVKRADEQQFARLNGANLMFCEDAARRIRYALDDLAIVSGFHFEVCHLESLHPHDAVSQISSGIDRGVRFRN
jgi:GTP cyclohydrolase I